MIFRTLAALVALLFLTTSTQAQQAYDPGGKARVSMYCTTSTPGDTQCPPSSSAPSPSNSSAIAIANAQSSATESGHAALCSAACNLYFLSATNLSTTTTLMVMVFNSTTVPADGAVTPDTCLPASPGPGATVISAGGGPPTRYSTGLSVALSSGASCTTKTASVNGFFTWKVKQ